MRTRMLSWPCETKPIMWSGQADCFNEPRKELEPYSSVLPIALARHWSRVSVVLMV